VISGLAIPGGPLYSLKSEISIYTPISVFYVLVFVGFCFCYCDGGLVDILTLAYPYLELRTAYLAFGMKSEKFDEDF